MLGDIYDLYLDVLNEYFTNLTNKTKGERKLHWKQQPNVFQMN